MTEKSTGPSDIARPRGRYPGYTRARLAAFSRRLERASYPARAEVDRIEMAGPTDRISHQDALGLDYRPVEIGEALGPLWATYWFQVTARIPEAWGGARVDLYWDKIVTLRLI